MKKHNFLIFNAGLAESEGQSGHLATLVAQKLQQACEVRVMNLASERNQHVWREHLAWADGFVFISGTYWDSWSSHLQYFLEQTTEWEGSDLWLGKPAAVLITMHSVGGKGVASRLQGVLSNLGAVLPPMSSFVYSLNTHLALQGDCKGHESDFWSLDDLDPLLANLVCAANIPRDGWQSWPVDSKNFKQKWIGP